MIEGGEDEVAVEELRWLIEGCHDFLEAHCLLGDLAAQRGDTKLARGHYGYAYDLGLAAMPADDWRGSLPYRLPANRGFLNAVWGLAQAQRALGELTAARALVHRLLDWDATDPLRVRQWLKGI